MAASEPVKPPALAPTPAPAPVAVRAATSIVQLNLGTGITGEPVRQRLQVVAPTPPAAREREPPAPAEAAPETRSERWSFADLSPAAVWTSGLAICLLLAATAMVADFDLQARQAMDSVGSRLTAIVHPPQPEPPRPPVFRYPHGKAADPPIVPVQLAAPRFVGIRSDACLEHLPDPNADPWSGKLDQSSSGHPVGVATQPPAGCFPSGEASR